MAWGLLYLADNASYQDKLRSKLHSVFPETLKESKQLSCSDILGTNVPYLEAVIEEIMRLSVVIPVLSRRATRDTTVLGHHIPKGTEVEFIFNGPGFLKPAFEVDKSRRTGTARESPVGDWDPNDIHRFNPDRWIEEDVSGKEVFNALRGPMLSFGGGPRGCYGKRLAYMEMRVLLAVLIWNFEFLPIFPKRRQFGILENITTEPSECLVRLKVLFENA
jgi:cytochrome P450